AGASALVGRLQDWRAKGGHLLAWAAAFVDNGVERRGEIVDATRGLNRPRLRRCERSTGLVLQVFDAVLAPFAEQGRQFDVDWGPVVLAGANGECAFARRIDREPHHGLVHGADLLDVESAIGDPLAWPATLAL